MDMSTILMCSECLQDQGLKLDATRIGISDSAVCPHCGSVSGSKLTKNLALELAHRFFVWGTFQRLEFGGAPVVKFNSAQNTSIDLPARLVSDVRLFERALGIGFFYYGPRTWMVGDVEPLIKLQDESHQGQIIDRILSEYPPAALTAGDNFYRLRNSPAQPDDLNEYDSAPLELSGSNRLDLPDSSVLYGSQDLEVCVHECRVTAEDDLYVATLVPSKSLKLVDLTHLLREEGTTEFESLDMAVHMLFMAGKHSYAISRRIAEAARQAGFDGILYPSYFSLLRTGHIPFDSAFGLSNRILPSLKDYEMSKIIPNIALFGWPVQEGKVEVCCINRLMLNKVEYSFHFGPVGT